MSATLTRPATPPTTTTASRRQLPYELDGLQLESSVVQPLDAEGVSRVTVRLVDRLDEWRAVEVGRVEMWQVDQVLLGRAGRSLPQAAAGSGSECLERFVGVLEDTIVDVRRGARQLSLPPLGCMLFVELAWVAPQFRGFGYGKTLVALAVRQLSAGRKVPVFCQPQPVEPYDGADRQLTEVEDEVGRKALVGCWESIGFRWLAAEFWMLDQRRDWQALQAAAAGGVLLHD